MTDTNYGVIDHPPLTFFRFSMTNDNWGVMTMMINENEWVSKVQSPSLKHDLQTIKTYTCCVFETRVHDCQSWAWLCQSLGWGPDLWWRPSACCISSPQCPPHPLARLFSVFCFFFAALESPPAHSESKYSKNVPIFFAKTSDNPIPLSAREDFSDV